MNALIAAVENEENVEGAIVGLIVVAVIAFVVYLLCRGAGREDLGRLGAAVIAIIGGLLVLLNYL